MSRARHHTKKEHHGKHHASGGAAVGNPHVFAEARGKELGEIHGKGAKKRGDRKHRASGGKVGCDSHPYTSAHKDGGRAHAAGHHEGLHRGR